VTLASIEHRCARLAAELGHELECFQSNAEHELIQRVQAAGSAGIGIIVINPAAFTHTSIALRDALTAVGIPFLEVHLSNVHGREAFRRRSYFSSVAAGVISGLGPLGYELAIRAADALLRGIDRN
jgi:3-dehydroquinate dehydratase II